MRGWRWAAALLVVVACSTSDDDEPKDTPETRCARLCAPPRDNPCFNTSATDTTCRTTCLARLSGKSDACQSCIHVNSGWMGQSCQCNDELGAFGSATCKTCTWKSSSQQCTTDVSNSCGAAAGCQGFVMAPVGDPACASTCGETPIADAGTD